MAEQAAELMAPRPVTATRMVRKAAAAADAAACLTEQSLGGLEVAATEMVRKAAEADAAACLTEHSEGRLEVAAAVATVAAMAMIVEPSWALTATAKGLVQTVAEVARWAHPRVLLGGREAVAGWATTAAAGWAAVAAVAEVAEVMGMVAVEAIVVLGE